MIPETCTDIPNNRLFAAQDVNSRGREENFIPDPLDGRGISMIPEPLRRKLGLEERHDLVFEPELRVHEEEGQVGKEVLQAGQKGLNFISFDIFRGEDFTSR